MRWLSVSNEHINWLNHMRGYDAMARRVSLHLQLPPAHVLFTYMYKFVYTSICSTLPNAQNSSIWMRTIIIGSAQLAFIDSHYAANMFHFGAANLWGNWNWNWMPFVSRLLRYVVLCCVVYMSVFSLCMQPPQHRSSSATDPNLFPNVMKHMKP